MYSTTPPPISTAAPAPADVTTRFELIIAGHVAGRPSFTRHGDGSYDEDYAFTDRGRGPNLHIHSDTVAAQSALSIAPR